METILCGSFLQKCIPFVEKQLKFYRVEGSLIPETG